MRLVKVFPYLFLMRFNPRICKRCDKANALATRAIMVSIHASVKDATQIKTTVVKNSSFNPRICKRCDKGVNYTPLKAGVSIHASVKDATQGFFTSLGIDKFQSTHL